MQKPPNPKREEARSSLTPELQDTFDELVADYQFFGVKHYDRPFVSYVIIADLVRQGWRCTTQQVRPRS